MDAYWGNYKKPTASSIPAPTGYGAASSWERVAHEPATQPAETAAAPAAQPTETAAEPASKTTGAVAEETGADKAAAAKPAAESAAEKAPRQAAGQLVMFEVNSPAIEIFPKCCKCHTTAETARFAIPGKATGSWKCPACNTKCTQLNRKFKKWPPSFAAHTETWKEEFYKGLHGIPLI